MVGASLHRLRRRGASYLAKVTTRHGDSENAHLHTHVIAPDRKHRALLAKTGNKNSVSRHQRSAQILLLLNPPSETLGDDRCACGGLARRLGSLFKRAANAPLLLIKRRHDLGRAHRFRRQFRGRRGLDRRRGRRLLA